MKGQTQTFTTIRSRLGDIDNTVSKDIFGIEEILNMGISESLKILLISTLLEEIKNIIRNDVFNVEIGLRVIEKSINQESQINDMLSTEKNHEKNQETLEQ